MEHVNQTVTLSGWVQRARDLGGMTFVEMSPEGAAKYLELADNAAWDRMKARLAEMGDTTSYDKLWATYHAN